MKKLVLKIFDAPFNRKEFETFHESIQRTMAEISMGLIEKGHEFDGMFVSIPTMNVYIWKRV